MGKTMSHTKLLALPLMSRWSGKVIESMAERKGQMTDMVQDGAQIQYWFKTPT